MRFSIRDLLWLLLLIGGVLASYRWGYEQGLDELDNGDFTALVTRRYQVPFVSDEPTAGRKDSDELIRIIKNSQYGSGPHYAWDDYEGSIKYSASDKTLLVTARRFKHLEIDRLLLQIQRVHDGGAQHGKTWRDMFILP